jgi:phosphoglycerol transferase
VAQQLETTVATPPPAPVPVREERAFPVGRGRVALESAVAAVVSLGYILIAYRIWDARLSVPLYEGGGDGQTNASWIKAVMENGWWLHNDNLGAPFGQNNHDFPLNGETLQVVAAKALGYVLPGYGEVMNVYYLAGFPVLAVVSLLILRHLRFRFAVALPIALAYTFLPFHIWHHEDHLTRSTYVTAPLACLLLLWTLSWRGWFLRDPEGRLRARNVRRGRLVLAVVIAVLIGATETMTTFFTATLLGATAIVAAVRWREPARLVVGFSFVGVLAATFLLVSVPSFIFWHSEGRNPVAGQRVVIEGELYGLKISNLVLPEPTHRFGPFSELGSILQRQTLVRSEGGQQLGTLATIGFFAALIILMGSGLRRRAGPGVRGIADRTPLLDHSALIVLLAVLCGTIAGFSNLIALTGFDQVRTWNRIVVIIGFAALIVTAIGVERILGRLQRRLARPAVVAGVACVALSAFALYDSPPPAPRDYPAMNASWDSDEAFADAIDARMPDDASSFQWPVYGYPEVHPPGHIPGYDHLRAYLHDDSDMRWSYGAVKGRPRADWQNTAGAQGPIAALPGLLGLGFTGYWVDTFGYDVVPLGVLRAQLRQTLKVEPIVSPDRRFLFYDLRPYKAQLGRSDADLRRQAFTMFGV